MLTIALAITISLSTLGQLGEATTTASDAKFTPLFNGKDLSGWYTFLQKHGKNSDPDKIITLEDGMIRLYRNATDGKLVMMGYIATEKEYGDYHLRFQYRWGTKKFEPRYALKRDAGLYYHIIGPDAVWPRALQFQVEESNVGDLIALHGFQLDTTTDPKTIKESQPTFLDVKEGGAPRVMGGKGIAYQKHLFGDHEVEGWNTAEIIASGDTVTHILNGRVLNRGKFVRVLEPEGTGPSRPVTRGRIALEIEAAEIDFRNVEIRSLEARPSAPN